MTTGSSHPAISASRGTCFIMMQVQNGKFVRVDPTEKGKFDCSANYLTEVDVDPSTAFKG